MSKLADQGYMICPYDPLVAAWAAAAYEKAKGICKTPGDMRHGGTWRVGVDELPNAADGSINGVALGGAWQSHVAVPPVWHQAQLSVIYPGYPRQDVGESDAAHRFRIKRDAAHVDGLLPEGSAKRRHLREPHAFILGLSLNHVTQSPLVVWPGSHVLMRESFVAAFAGVDPDHWGDVDVTDTYQATRAKVFAQCPRVEVPSKPGEAVLLDRHLVHGVAPWGEDTGPAEGRMIAYFRPQFTRIGDWL